MAKNEINANFENLKAEMMKRKEVAKETKNKLPENKNINVNVNDYINTNDVCVKNECVNQEHAHTQTSGISANKIVIKKTMKVQPPKRITYYLNQDTIEKIDEYSKITGMGKSEFVQTLLDISLNNLEIE